MSKVPTRQTRQGFRPFWPTASPPPRDVAIAKVEQLSQQVHSSEGEAHNTARHNLLWKLMHNYIPADPNTIQMAFVTHMEHTIADSRFNFNLMSAYLACSYTVRDRLIELFNDTQEYVISQGAKQVYYVSIEFLVGRFLRNALLNLELEDTYREALTQLDVSIDELYNEEYDPGLGNGGLGRLAACFMDSLATLNYPAWGYGLMYSFGMFKQTIGGDGSQLEVPDYWLRFGEPWRIQKETVIFDIPFYGSVINGKWQPGLYIRAVANDFLIPGFATDNTLALRLWSSKPTSDLDEGKFRSGDYYDAIAQKQKAENLTSVLYPNDNTYGGKEMRLMQEFFMCSATLHDIIRRLYHYKGATIQDLPKYAAVQLNDTHPTLCVLELLRILMDDYSIPFLEAFNITHQVFSYTCHTLMPEALEKWSLPLFRNVLPRHLEIVFQLNQYYLDSLISRGIQGKELAKYSIIEEGGDKSVRMANVCVIGSHTVNGVAAIHSRLMTENVFSQFAELEPEKFQNKTNGVTVRRWLHHCNPGLSTLITSVVGNENWALDTSKLTVLTTKLNDPVFLQEWSNVKLANKRRLADYIKQNLGVTLDPETQIFDIQVKRIHEYKRQTLNILGCIDRYLRIIDLYDQCKAELLKGAEPETTVTDEEVLQQMTGKIQPKAMIFGGKAAPGYYFAKILIKLINNVGKIVNNDKRVGDFLKVIFIPNYNVSLAEMIIPASDVNEQISTAGTEASGTSNMKFAFNSSLIVGTWDGANIEIGEDIGEENVFFFGAKADEIDHIRETQSTRPMPPRLQRVIDTISSGLFGNSVENDYQCIIKSLIERDHYLCAYDFDSYLDAQARIDVAYQDVMTWTKMGITSTAKMGRFSSDRTITEYAEQIWGIKPCQLPPAVSENEPSLAPIPPPQPGVGSLRRHSATGSLGNNQQQEIPAKGGFGSLSKRNARNIPQPEPIPDSSESSDGVIIDI
jgi:starch phosphorylase